MPNVGAVTLLQLRTAVRDRADMVNSQFITDATFNNYINASCQQLYEKMIEAYGSDYWVQSPFTITTDGVNDQFALPTDFFKLLGTDLQISTTGNAASGWVTLWRFNFAQRNQYTLPNIQSLWGRTNLKYKLVGGNIWFIPLPMAAINLRLWYAPRFTPLASDSDVFDGINGWEEWVINDSAMKAGVKEETDISGLQALQAVQEERLSHVIENRDAGSAPTTVDVNRANGFGNVGMGFEGEDWSP